MIHADFEAFYVRLSTSNSPWITAEEWGSRVRHRHLDVIRYRALGH